MRENVHLLVGAYAVGALPEDEVLMFEAHLASCESCATELPGLLETAARLGDAEHAPPPERLRSTVLTAAAATRQLPPRVTPLRRPARWRGWAAVAAGVVLVAAVAGLGAQSLRLDRDADRARATAAAVATVLTEPDAEVATAEAEQGRAAVVWSPSTGLAVFLASGLPELPGDRAYQLWYVGTGAPRSAGLLAVGEPARPLDPGSDTRLVAVTVEPAAGSPAPTTPPLLAIPLAS